MASLDFGKEKKAFSIFYEEQFALLTDAKNSFITLVTALTTKKNLGISKVEGRVKNKKECIKKFSRKYRTQLEEQSIEYEIKEYITDLIGLRIVCLYEDDIDVISEIIKEHFEVIDVTDKISEMESTEDSFGYKGLHLRLRLKGGKKAIPDYELYRNLEFEIQIRTIIQDSWSVLDHKIKYKKSIPNHLKRRINILAALFELADREFREIRDSTTAEIEKVEEIAIEEIIIDEIETKEEEQIYTNKLNAFNFLKIGNHFFNEFEFEPYKVDDFVHEIQNLFEGITRKKFHHYINKNISFVKTYLTQSKLVSPNDRNNPYTILRHCLYAADKLKFRRILTNSDRALFDAYNNENK